MGCYGVGLTRVMAAAVEVLATSDNIIWPRAIAPYKVCIIGPKVSVLFLCGYVCNSILIFLYSSAKVMLM